MTDAAIGYGTVFGIASVGAPTVFTTITEITSVTPPKHSRDTIDATHMQSPGGYREYILNLKDGGEASIDLNLVPGGASHALLMDMRDEDDPRPFKITLPNGGEWTFDALLSDYEETVPVDDKMTATATFKVTGHPVFIFPS